VIEATTTLPLPDIEHLPIARVDQQVDVIGQAVRERPGDGFRLREGGHLNEVLLFDIA
jgi:hypothetical protein